MYQPSAGPSLLQVYRPVAIVWPPVANDNGGVLLRQASVRQLIDAITARIQEEPVEHRQTFSALALSLATFKIGVMA